MIDNTNKEFTILTIGWFPTLIDRLFKRVRIAAWNSIKYREDIYKLIEEQKAKKTAQQFKSSQTYNLLNMYK